ncbi:hypothetical protein EJB05_02501, partial [Eragrostis curvula]
MAVQALTHHQSEVAGSRQIRAHDPRLIGMEGGLRGLAKKAAVAVLAANGGAPPPPPEGTTYDGVRLRPSGKWSVEIRDSPTTRVWLGSYDTAVEAACAYDAAVRTLRPGKRTNFPEPPEVDKEERVAVVLAHVAGVKRKRHGGRGVRLVPGRPGSVPGSVADTHKNTDMVIKSILRIGSEYKQGQAAFPCTDNGFRDRTTGTFPGSSPELPLPLPASGGVARVPKK